MDNFSSISRTRTNLSMGSSKIYGKDAVFGLNDLKLEQKLDHQHCDCFHCTNNTKPIPQPIHSRIPGSDEYQKPDNEAYAFVIQKMADFIGTVKVPDTFIAQSSTLVYVSSQNKNRIKSKPNVALSELKKYFDSRRVQYNKIIKSQNEFNFGKIQRNNSKSFNLSDIRLTRRQTTNTQMIKKQKEMKQIAMINSPNSFSQIVVESSLNKYLGKRKNDPFWQEISSISLIPPYKEDELTYHKYFYERTEGNVKEMDVEMERVAGIIDSQDKYNDMSSVVSSTLNPQGELTNEKDSMEIQKSRQSFSPKNIQPSFLRQTTLDNLAQQKLQTETVAKISKQIIAYFEVKLHIRISSCLFKYVIDFEGNYYLAGVEKFIAHDLKQNELRFVHDRFAQFDVDDGEQIAELKMQIQNKESRALQHELAELVADCLEKRKLELQNVGYKRPSNQNLVKIFKKIFPTFDQEQVFTNKNWKNEFPVYMQNCRKAINNIIREDEGIRILKRFGVNFYRTWS